MILDVRFGLTLNHTHAKSVPTRARIHHMCYETMLIELCDRLGLALDINYLRGTVTVGRKRFTKIADAVAYAQSRVDALKI